MMPDIIVAITLPKIIQNDALHGMGPSIHYIITLAFALSNTEIIFAITYQISHHLAITEQNYLVVVCLPQFTYQVFIFCHVHIFYRTIFPINGI